MNDRSVARTMMKRLLLFLLVLDGCHRSYVIQGEIVVAPDAPARVRQPSLLCVGNGGALQSSGVWGHPASANEEAAEGTLFCGRPAKAVSFPLRESIYYGSVPQRAHVYAWLFPVPRAQDLCARAGTPMIKLDIATLDRLISPGEADKPPQQRAPSGRPCGQNPTQEMPMDFAVTFDPDHKTWTEEDAGWIERRTLHIR
jgi:hypothetical protein